MQIKTRRMKMLLTLLCLSGWASAQTLREVKPRDQAERKEVRQAASPEIGLGQVRTEFRFGGKVVKHAPYTAEAITESTQTLANGAKLAQKTVARLYRDGEGRTRREQSSAPVGPFATAGAARRVIFISDPVAGFAFTLYPDEHMAYRTALPAAEVIDAANPPAVPPPLRHGERRPPPERGESRPPRPANQGQMASLGKREIAGLPADGERTTLVIPAGSIGNDQPLEIVEERWKSPDLRTVLWSKTSDPRWGETTYQLTRITRGEPDATLFVVPSDYTIKEGEPVAPKPKAGQRKGVRGIR